LLFSEIRTFSDESSVDDPKDSDYNDLDGNDDNVSNSEEDTAVGRSKIWLSTAPPRNRIWMRNVFTCLISSVFRDQSRICLFCISFSQDTQPWPTTIELIFKIFLLVYLSVRKLFCAWDNENYWHKSEP